jgi:citrate synthase
MKDTEIEQEEIKEIIVYKSAVSLQQLKQLCATAYNDFPTPLQRINSVISKLKEYDHSLGKLRVTKEEWNDLEDNVKFKEIARKFNNKEIKQQEERRAKKKLSKKFID